MDLLGAIIRGAVQGVTEFLPISSDGHLVVVGHYLGETGTGRDALGFDILLHCGSLIAILIGFRDVWTRVLRGLIARDAASWKTAGLIVLATIPGVIAGLFFEDTVAGMRSLTAASVGFLVTAACLIAGEWVGRRHNALNIRWIDALLIGVAQAFAILPGVSRSGLTVSTARSLGIERSYALDFSFLMAVPIIAGAVAKTGLDAFQGDVAFPTFPVSLAGFASSLIVSFGAILFLRRFVRGNSFAWFAWYLIPLALLLLAEDFGLRTYLDAEHATAAVRTLGGLAVFAFALVEIVPPFSFISPGITALVVAGSLAPDPLSLIVFIICAVSASFIGNVVLYYVGVYAGPSFERALRLPDGARQKAEAFVQRAGGWAVMGGQFFSASRPTVAFAAGVLKMHPAQFFSSALVGAVLWGASSLIAGYVLRENIGWLVTALLVLGAVATVAFAIVAVVRWRRMRQGSVR